MGIAGFYLWLEKLYPQCIEDIPQEFIDALLANFEKRRSVEGSTSADSDEPAAKKVRVEGSASNKKKTELSQATSSFVKTASGKKRVTDNFYVDMNGLIHPCCHDTHPLPEPETEEEMLERCFDQLDLLVQIVQPQKCLVLCIDGVAPRSKMNQQRVRRFRSAQEKRENEAIAAECADEIIQKYGLPPPRVRERWDSNVITPATAFMEKVGIALEWFILKKLNEDESWKHLTVIFSDAMMAGEGEHKIMHYIRGLRAAPEYNPNTTHVIHGMDADLICLGLITHEYHVSILRNQLNETFQPDHSRFSYFNLETFRNCLKFDFADITNMNFENVVDDFVFLCFLVGNDFLPHVPLISIKAKSIELLLDHYVRYFSSHLYLTKNGEVNFSRLHEFLQTFVANEKEELKKQYNFSKRAKLRAQLNVKDRVEKAEAEIEGFAESIRLIRQEEEAADTIENPSEGTHSDKHNTFSKRLQDKSDELFALHTSIQQEQLRLVVDKQPLTFSYLSKDYQVAYYFSKFGWREAEPSAAKNNPEALQKKISECCAEYLRGMQWVMRYYTQGCPSWDWFYPFHYAPLVEDLANFSGVVNVKMAVGSPLHPILQLLAVLPRESVEALPEELHAAVQNKDSSLDPFYPDDLDPDYSEANFSYQAVLRLEFVDCEKMKSAVEGLIRLKENEGRMLVLCHESTFFSRFVLSSFLNSASAREMHSSPDSKQKSDGTSAKSASNSSSSLNSIVEVECEELQKIAAHYSPIPKEVVSSIPIAGLVAYRLPLKNSENIFGMKDDVSNSTKNMNTIITCPNESAHAVENDEKKMLKRVESLQHQQIECPDVCLARASTIYSSPILSNQVSCFSYRFLDPAPYKQELLPTVATRKRKSKKKANKYLEKNNHAFKPPVFSSNSLPPVLSSSSHSCHYPSPVNHFSAPENTAYHSQRKRTREVDCLNSSCPEMIQDSVLGSRRNMNHNRPPFVSPPPYNAGGSVEQYPLPSVLGSPHRYTSPRP